MPFSVPGLSPALAGAAQALGFDTPTPIQAAAIPPALQGADVLGSAQTGSGKTAAFALPLLQWVVQQPAAKPRPVRALVLVPTRELAVQAGELLRSLARELPERPQVAVVFGGVSINPQMMALRGGADVVVATPGRLLDLVAHNALRLSAVGLLVLDEADRLLDLGFADELQRVLGLLPARRQNLFFSATFPPAVEALAATLLHEPVRVAVVAETPAEAPDIRQRAIRVDASKRTALLRHLAKTESWQRVLVFVATRHAAETVAAKLYKNGVFATAFHGDMAQGTRQQILDEFRDDRWEVVVTTDLAARGIDIARLPVVVNYDLPRSPTDYTHRIGRTGRAGESGQALSFISTDTDAHFRLIEKRNGLQLERETIAGFEPVDVEPAAVAATEGFRPDPNGGIKGKRPSKKDKLRAAATAAAADKAPPPGR